MSSKLNVAVLGLDNWYHAFPFSQVLGQSSLANLVAIVDENAEQAQWAAQNYGAQRWSTDPDSVINDPAIDAVVLTVFTAKHAEVGVRAARAGKHILCDKPIEVSVAKADELIKAVQDAKVTFQMSFPRRFSPLYRRARQLIKDGAIGHVTCIIETGRWPLPRISPTNLSPGWYADPAKAGFGAFGDHAVHQVDALRYILDDEVVEVRGQTGNLVHKEIGLEDYGIATMTFRSGVIATVESTWTTIPPARIHNQILIQGSEGDLAIDPVQNRLQANSRVLGGTVSFDVPTGPTIEVVAGHAVKVNQYQAVVENFLKSVIAGRAVDTATLYDGRAATEICEAVYKAARLGQPVTLPLT